MNSNLITSKRENSQNETQTERGQSKEHCGLVIGHSGTNPEGEKGLMKFNSGIVFNEGEEIYANTFDSRGSVTVSGYFVDL